MKKKNSTSKIVALKSRQSFDKKLAALAPSEQMHQLFHGRPNDGGLFEYHLRQLATCRKIHEQREKSYWQRPVNLMKDGQIIDSRTWAEQNFESLQTELRALAAYCNAALQNWQPETLEHMAALMRKIQSEEPSGFNPFAPACGMDVKAYLRAMILSESTNGPVNQWQLACHFENTNPNPKLQKESEFIRTDSTRKAIGGICKRLKIPSRIGRPKLEK